MLHDPRKDAKIAEELFHAGLQPWQLELLAAAEKLKRDGWCRHELGRPIGPTCALGSLWMVRGFLDDLGNVKLLTNANRHDARAQEFRLVKFLGDEVAYWNDEVAETVHDVVRVFQYVALG